MTGIDDGDVGVELRQSRIESVALRRLIGPIHPPRIKTPGTETVYSHMPDIITAIASWIQLHAASERFIVRMIEQQYTNGGGMTAEHSDVDAAIRLTPLPVFKDTASPHLPAVRLGLPSAHYMCTPIPRPTPKRTRESSPTGHKCSCSAFNTGKRYGASPILPSSTPCSLPSTVISLPGA